MKRTTKIFLFISFIALAFGCGNTATKASSGLDKVKESKFYKLYPEFSQQDLISKFRGNISSDRLLSPFYSATNYDLIWVKDTLNTTKIVELVTILSEVDRHGLSKQAFPTERIIAIAKSIDAGQYSASMNDLYDELIELEKLASSSAIKYSLGMRFGFLDPKKLYGRNYAIVIDRTNAEYYNQLYQDLSKDAIATLIQSQPYSEEYRLLLSEYTKLDTLKNSSVSKIPSRGKGVYKLLDRGDGIIAISRRLALTGEYDFTPDTVGLNTQGYILDDKLLEAVNKFRQENSISEEKEIGAQTIDALNRPLTYYQEKVKANLERYRWRRSKEKHAKHIEVNVASQLLLATHNGRQAIEMRVAVGSLKNKTPLLQSDISYINLNPIWNVPTSIARKELSVKQKGNRSYLQRNNMKLYKEGREIPIESVDWDAVVPENFGYSIKQTSGDHNALGKMKFMFNNNFAVYLHDTPSKATFGKQNRAVSHGCVRLQRPIDLALFLTNASDVSFADRLYHTIDMKAPSPEGQKLQAERKMTKLNDIIRMDEEVSLFIDYFTVYFKPEDRTMYYADDVYSYDKPIINGLDSLGGETNVLLPLKKVVAEK